ncbi:THAP domain-containing protein 7 isoform X1 [Microcaecilia unicolor]|uniref:THAP domain-containing protein 7 isoform X1 n=1 Tax=Microcaecilia unicolor TaxID=1415580 RepID=A0A6P7XFK0_9AMPH|nr:THAP domain-containing protein 7 isoform X1 [Microcaecilia unicolor]
MHLGSRNPRRCRATAQRLAARPVTPERRETAAFPSTGCQRSITPVVSPGLKTVVGQTRVAKGCGTPPQSISTSVPNILREAASRCGYHRLKETAVPTIFEDFVKLQNVKARTQGLAHKARPVRRRKRLALLRAHTPVPAIPDSASTVPIGGEAIAGASPRMTDGCHLHDLRTGSDHVPGSTAPAEGSEAAAVELETHPSATLEDGQDAEPPSDCVMVPPPDVFATPSQRPVSPSAYMLRLPPPPGAYIQSEHSYHVGSALLWKRRAEAALDALDKAQRQLQACKRREHRLRLRIHALQQERAREKRGQSDVRERLKEHLQVFALELINDYVSPCSSEVTAL